MTPVAVYRVGQPQDNRPLGMKIGESNRIRGADRSVRETVRSVSSDAAKAYGSAPQPRAIEDSASIMGIPETDLTPKVREAIMTLMQEVDKLRTALDQTQRRLSDVEQLADQDALLFVFNRRTFVRELSRMISFAERYQAPASLLYFDVDGFKAVNDSFGHAAGDVVLKRIADTLVENVRESDIVGRIGGDEFGVILAQAGEEAAVGKATRLADMIAALPLEWEGAPIDIGISFGVYSFKPGEDAGQALAAADKAMYAHKNKTAAR